jgi:hypothetical protein
LIFGCLHQDYGVQNEKIKIKRCTDVIEVHEQRCFLHLLSEVVAFLAPNNLAGGLLMTCGIKRKLHSGITTASKAVRRDKESTEVLPVHKLPRMSRLFGREVLTLYDCVCDGEGCDACLSRLS